MRKLTETETDSVACSSVCNVRRRHNAEHAHIRAALSCSACLVWAARRTYRKCLSPDSTVYSLPRVKHPWRHNARINRRRAQGARLVVRTRLQITRPREAAPSAK